MRSVHAPIKNRVDLEREPGVSSAWRQYYDSLIKANSKFNSVTYGNSTILASVDLGKIVKMNVGNGTLSCKLPSVSNSQIDSWIIIMKLGLGKLIIRAADFDTIESSNQGGSIICDEPGRVLANVYLVLATETQWGIIGSTGIWRVY